MTQPHTPAEMEIVLGRLIVDQGLAQPNQVEECLMQIAELQASGVPAPRLGDFMISKGYLTPSQVKVLARMMQALAASQPPRLSESQRLTMPPSALEAARDPDNHVGKYLRVDRIGTGGMGEVWRAWDPELRRWTALKFLRYRDPSEVQRFKREAQTAAKLHHPNICAVYEVGEHDGRLYIAMQYAEGQTLSTFPRQDRRLLVELLRDVTLAVHYAHEQGFVHRDLKPSNIMVEGDPRERKKSSHPTLAHKINFGFKVFVMDFGLVKPIDSKSSVSQTGMAIGTPVYMSPEQAAGNVSAVGPRSDVYSLGATLYELMTDRPPFRHGEIYELLIKVIEEDPIPLRRINPRVDVDLERIVMKAMHKDPKLRYGTALELAEDLTRWLEGERVLASPTSTRRRSIRNLSDRRLWFVAGAAVLVLAFGLMWYLISQEAHDRRSRDEARARVTDQLALTADACLVGAANARRAGELPEAKIFEETLRKAVQAVLRDYPEAAEPHFHLGAMNRVLLKEDEALLDQHHALAQSPELAGARYEHAVLLALRYARRTEEVWWDEIFSQIREERIRLARGVMLPEFSRTDRGARDPLAGDFRSQLKGDLRRLATQEGRAGAFARMVEAWLEGDRRGARQASPGGGRDFEQSVERVELLAGLELEEGRPADAVRLLGEALERDRGAVPLLEARARARLLWGLRRVAQDQEPGEQFRGAVDDMERALVIQSSRVSSWQLRGRIHWLMARWKAVSGQKAEADFRLALDDFTEAARLNPSREPEFRLFVEDCRKRLGP